MKLLNLFLLNYSFSSQISKESASPSKEVKFLTMPIHGGERSRPTPHSKKREKVQKKDILFVIPTEDGDLETVTPVTVTLQSNCTVNTIRAKVERQINLFNPSRPSLIILNSKNRPIMDLEGNRGAF